MILALYGITDPKTTVSLISGGKVWSPGSKAWEATATDALVAPTFYGDPNHAGLAEVTFPAVVDPGAPVSAVLHDAGGKPIGAPLPVGSTVTANLYPPGLVNLGR